MTKTNRLSDKRAKMFSKGYKFTAAFIFKNQMGVRFFKTEQELNEFKRTTNTFPHSTGELTEAGWVK